MCAYQKSRKKISKLSKPSSVLPQNVKSEVIPFSEQAMFLIDLICIAFLLFFKIFSFGLSYFDDQIWIEDYKGFFQNWNNISYFFKNADFISGTFYRPILNMAFLIDAKIGGGALWSYRLSNILLHIADSFLIYLLLLKLGTRKNLARFLSLCFICHPALTQAVAWIPGKTDSLFGLFCLTMIISFISFQEKKTFWSLIFCLGSLILAFLTKETAICLPVICILYLWFWKKERNLSSFLIWMATFGVLTFIWLAHRAQFIDSLNKPSLVVALKSMLQNSPSVLIYFGKIFLPFNLCVMPILKDVTYVYAVLAFIFFVGVVSLAKSYDKGKFCFGLAWFVLFIAPSLVMSFIEHEYRLYMPMVGILITLSVLNIDQLLNSKYRLGIGIFIVCSFAAVTFIRTDEFKDRLTFWRHAVQCAPHSPLAHRNLAAMYYLDQHFKEAEEEWLKTVDLNFSEPMVHNNLGLIYMGQGLFDKSEQEYLKEIRVNPYYGNAYFNFALLRFAQGKNEDGVELLKKAVKYDPRHIKALTVLVQYFTGMNNSEEANFYRHELRKLGVENP